MRIISCIVSNHDGWAGIFEGVRPVVLKNIASKWPATLRWKDFIGLKERTKYTDTVVQVETGGTYTSSNMELKFVQLSDLLDYFNFRQQVIVKSNTDDSVRLTSPHVYLAQQGIEDIPPLLEDIETPELVKAAMKKGLHGRKLWLGGADGTHSACHYDPYENLLCQVFGYKRVLLFPPEAEECLYPLRGTVHKNTSQVAFLALSDIIFNELKSQNSQYSQPLPQSHDSTVYVFPSYNPLLSALDMRYPRLFQAQGFCAVVGPGDGLFIPKRWWHFCHAPSSSCSVNFWWL